MANLLKYFERESEGVAYAPKHGGSYSQTDVLATVYERLAQICKQRNEIVRLRAKYDILGGHQLRVRDRAIAKMLGEKHEVLRERIAELEESSRIPQRRAHEMLEEIRKSDEAAQHFSNISTDSAALQHIVDATEGLKLLFIKVFNLPEEVLDPEWVEHARNAMSTGTSTSTNIVSSFTTTRRQCQTIVNRALDIEPERASWSFFEVSAAIETLGSEAAQVAQRQEKLNAVSEELELLQHKHEEYEKEARAESTRQQKTHEAATINLQTRLAEANSETETWKRQAQDFESQMISSKQAHEGVDDRVTSLQSDLDRTAMELQSLRQSFAPAQLELADQLAAAKQQLRSTESELETIKSHLKVEEDKNRELEQKGARMNTDLSVRGEKIKTLERQSRSDRARWTLLVQELITTYGTGQVIPEEIMAPMLVVAEQDVDVVELSSEMLDWRSPVHDQSITVHYYHGFSSLVSNDFNHVRVLKVLVDPNITADDMIWLEKCIIPKVTREMGASNGKPSTYVLLMYPSLQNRMLTARGLSRAIAASALVEVYTYFPFKNDVAWTNYLRALIPSGFDLESLPLLERAAYAKLVTTLAGSQDQMEKLLDDHAIGVAALEGRLHTNQSIPDIMEALLTMNPEGAFLGGTSQVLIREGGRRLIAVDDGTEECIFAYDGFASWSCCTSGFIISSNDEDVAVRCAASRENAWRSSQLIDYTEGSPRYAAATAEASHETAERKTDGVLAALRALSASEATQDE